MEKTNSNPLIRLLLIPAIMLNFACKVDDEYNLEDIDIDDITVLPGLSMPLGSFKTISLGELLNLEDLDFVSVDNEGNYFFNFKMDEFSYTYNSGEVKVGPNVLTETKTLGTGITVPSQGAWTTMSIEIPATFSSSFQFKENNFVPEIKAIREINCDAVLHYSIKPESSYHFGKITFLAKSSSGKETTITFPEWTVIESCSDSRIKLIDNHTLKLNSDITVSSSQGLSIDLVIKGLKDIPEDLGVTKEGKLALEGIFLFDGTLSASGADLLNGYSGPMTFVIDNRFSYDSFKIKSGVVKLDVNPEFATQDYVLDSDSQLSESNIILNDLKVSVNLDNGIPVKFSAKTDLYTSVGGTVSHLYPIVMDFPASTKTEYIFVGSMPAEKESQANYVVLQDLNSILSPIPDKFVLSEITASTDPNEWVRIETEKDYKSTCSVAISSSASLASGSTIDITEDIDFNIDDLGDYAKAVEVSLNVINSLPFSLQIDSELLDYEGNTIPGTTLTIQGTIAPGSVSSPSENPLSIRIDNNGDNTVKKLRLHMRTTAESDAALNKNQGIALKNIVITLPKGIKI